jgi:hypothetical protein
MSKKMFGKVFILLLVVGLLFAVAPTGQAQAQTPSGYSFIVGGTGTAQLSSEQYYSGSNSVKLATVTTDDRGMVRFEFAPDELKLDDLTHLSYYEYVDARDNPLDVFIDIWLDINDDGVADANDYDGYMQAEPYYTLGAAPLDTWTYIDAMTLKWSTYVGPDDPYNAPTIAQLQANTVPTWTNNVDFGQLDVLRVDIRVGYGGTWTNFTGYADDIRINSYIETFPPNEVWVDDDDATCGGNSPCFATIQGGINAVAAGGTVNVLPGTYASISANKAVTLLGPNAGVHPAVGTHPTETVGTRGPEAVVGGLVPSADNVTVDGFKFSKAGTRLIDTYANANNFTMRNCIIESTTAGATTGVMQFGGGSHLDMLIEFNLFTDLGDHTFYAAGGPYDGMTFQYNKFQGAGDSFFWSASPLVDGVIKGNEFDGESGTNFNTINIGKAGNLQLTDNWFHDNYYTGAQVGIIGGTISGNTFEKSYPYPGYGGRNIELWGGAWGTAVSTNVTITGNKFYYNDIPGAAYPSHGLRLLSTEDGSGVGGIDGSTIHVYCNEFYDGGARTDAFAIRHNGDQTTSVDADSNYWGSATPDFTGKFQGPVTYVPYNTDDTCGTPVYPPVHNVTQDTYFFTIQAAIDAAENGDTIEVAAGTYAENVDVTKPVTLLGPNAGVAGNGTRVAEAIIQGTSASWVSLYVEPNIPGVTIDGFKFDGANLVDPTYTVGVAGDSSGLTVQNNVFVNHDGMAIMTSGVYTEDDGETWKYDKWLTDILIKDNLITNTTLSTSGYNFGIYFQSSLGTVSGNVVTNMRNGIQVQPYWNTPGGGVISGNTFEAYRTGIYFNYIQNATADWEFTDNLIQGIAYPTGLTADKFNAILVQTFSAGQVDFNLNQVLLGTSNATEQHLYNEISVTDGISSATPNWWGSAAGPATGQIVGTADYIPWCGEAECTTLVYPEYNGTVSGVLTTSGTGAVSGTLTGAYNLTVTGQVTEYVNNRATFSGTVTGDIVGDITASINEMGVGTLAGTVTNTGAILPVRILGIFPQSGTTGDFTGQIITGEVPDLATSMSITTPDDVSTVFAGGTLQLGVEIDQPLAEYGAWSIWEAAAPLSGSTISEDGLLIAGSPKTIVVIVKALDGSLLHATKTITIEPALVSIAPVDPVVCGNTTTTTIDINVAGIPASIPLQGYQFRLHFDETLTSIANLTTDPIDIVNGGFIEDGGFFVINYIDETTGLIVTGPTGIVDISYAQVYPSTSTGDGLLASVTLTHLGVPGDIELLLSDVVLSDRDSYVIPSEFSATPTTLTLEPAVLNTTKSLGYCTLADAVAGADAGDNLELQADIAIPATVTVDKALTLDLNGKVATGAAGVTVLQVTTGGALTIEDTLEGGTIRAVGSVYAINVNGGGSLLVNDGAIQGEYGGVKVESGSSMTLAGGDIGGSFGTVKYSGIGVYGSGATLTVKSGTITSYDFGIWGNGQAQYAGTSITIEGGTITSDNLGIYHPQDGVLTISGGTIIGTNGIEMKAGDLSIFGGTILGTGAYADPLPNDNGSTDTGDAILLNGRDAYTGDITVTITGGTITSTNAYALRDYKAEDQALKTSAVLVSGGSFTGGVQAVTFSDDFVALPRTETSGLMLTGGFYNTDPADPDVYVFVPYGTVYNTTEAMYEIVGISLNAADFGYVNYLVPDGVGGDLGYMRGATSGFTTTNFNLSEATAIVVKLYSGETLLQTNTFDMEDISILSNAFTSPFDIFGTFDYATDGYWTNERATNYGQQSTLAPTKVVATVTLPGGDLTATNTTLSPSDYTLIDPVLVAEDFAYMAFSDVLGVTAGFHPVNFTLDQALTLKVELFAGTQLLQTNISPVPSVHGVALLQQFSGPFDIFGTFDYVHDYATGTTPYWINVRGDGTTPLEYGQTLVPTRVLATVTLPGGVTRTVENLLLTGDRDTILPDISGTIKLQGRSEFASVPLYLTAGEVVIPTTTTGLLGEFTFDAVEGYEYTFTTLQPRYLNLTLASAKFILADKSKTLPVLQLRGGNAVWMDGMDDTNDIIDINDASLVGGQYGTAGADTGFGNHGDCNFDDIVNIQDLALVGGNFDLQSDNPLNTTTFAYAAWLQ